MIMEPVVIGQPDRHLEKPLSLRLGPLRQQVEERAAELDLPVRRFILDVITEKLGRPCHCLCGVVHGDVPGICTGEATATISRWSATGTASVPVCGGCHAAVVSAAGRADGPGGNERMRNMATRPEDRNADQRFESFEDGATLTELKSFITELEGLGAPGDARPHVKLNEDGEIIGIVCVTKRRPEISEPIEHNRR